MCDSWSRCVISRFFIESVDSFIFLKENADEGTGKDLQSGGN